MALPFLFSAIIIMDCGVAPVFRTRLYHNRASPILPGGVGSWRSGRGLYLQLPLIKPYLQVSRVPLSDHLPPAAYADCVHGALMGILKSPSVSYKSV